MSPVAADRLTCTTSVEVKIAYATRRSYGQLSRLSESKETHLVREDERKFYFVSYFCIPTTPQGERTWGTSSNGGDETECRHCMVGTVCYGSTDESGIRFLPPKGPRKRRFKTRTPNTCRPGSGRMPRTTFLAFTLSTPNHSKDGIHINLGNDLRKPRGLSLSWSPLSQIARVCLLSPFDSRFMPSYFALDLTIEHHRTAPFLTLVAFVLNVAHLTIEQFSKISYISDTTVHRLCDATRPVVKFVFSLFPPLLTFCT